MSGKYAKTTTVSVSQSRLELEGLLERYGADQFAYGSEAGLTQIGFRIKGLYVRLVVPMPLPDDKEFARNAQGHVVNAEKRQSQWRQATMQRWRALVLVTKAKLEAVEIGISTLEREFLADVLLPDGRSVGDTVFPEIRQAYLTGKQPAHLLAERTGS